MTLIKNTFFSLILDMMVPQDLEIISLVFFQEFQLVGTLKKKILWKTPILEKLSVNSSPESVMGSMVRLTFLITLHHSAHMVLKAFIMGILAMVTLYYLT